MFVVSQGGISVGFENHAGLLPVVRRILNPAYLPNDFGIALRYYHHRAFAYLVAGCALLFGEDRALVILRAAGHLFLSAALYRLCRELRLNAWGFLAAGAFLAGRVFWTGRGLEVNELIGNAEINPTTYAHALVLLGVAALLRRRLLSAAFLAGLTLLFHLQIGLIFVALLFPFYLPLLKSYDRGRLVRAGLLLLVPASLALIYLALMVGRGVARSGVHDYNAYRQPHHFELLSAHAAAWVIAHLVAQTLVWWHFKNRDAELSRAAGVFTLLSLTLVLLALLHFLDFYVLQLGPVSMVQLIRMSPLITLFGALSVIAALNYWARGGVATHAGRVAALNLALVVLSVGWAFWQRTIPPLEKFAWVKKYADQPTNWSDVCRWIKTNGPRNALYMTPPAAIGFASLTDRSTVVEFKINPDGGQRLGEWYERLRDVGGGTLPQLKGFANARALNTAYGSLTAAQLRALGRKYGAAYALLPATSTADFPVLYQNQDYKLVQLTAEN
jgi:hypothetical protein